MAGRADCLKLARVLEDTDSQGSNLCLLVAFLVILEQVYKTVRKDLTG